MMSSGKCARMAKSQPEYDLESLPARGHARCATGDAALDIRVVTEVEVQVEKIHRDSWRPGTSAKGARKQGSTENLV